LDEAGSYNTQGTVKIYLEDEGKKYLLFDSSELESKDIISITGLVVSGEKDKGKDKEKGNETGNESSEPGNETVSLPENATINETNESDAQNNLTINNSILINLKYKSNTPYDTDDNGIENIYGVIDFTTENTQFNWEADEKTMHKMEY